MSSKHIAKIIAATGKALAVVATVVIIVAEIRVDRKIKVQS